MNGQDTAAPRSVGRYGRVRQVVAATAAILVAATTALVVTAASPAHAAGAPAVSGPPFGRAPQVSTSGHAQVYRIRTGDDGAYDRVVFDAHGLPPYRVQYVGQVLRDPSGLPVAMRGHYFLRITLQDTYTGATSWTDPSLVPSVINTPGLPEIKQSQQVGEFENVTTFALGLERSRGFRVFRLTGPDRLVVDVLH